MKKQKEEHKNILWQYNGQNLDLKIYINKTNNYLNKINYLPCKRSKHLNKFKV